MVGGSKKRIKTMEGSATPTEWRHTALAWQFGNMGRGYGARNLDRATGREVRDRFRIVAKVIS